MMYRNRTYQQVELSDAQGGDRVVLSEPIIPVGFHITGRDGNKVTIQSEAFTVNISDVAEAYGYRANDTQGSCTVR